MQISYLVTDQRPKKEINQKQIMMGAVLPRKNGDYDHPFIDLTEATRV